MKIKEMRHRALAVVSDDMPVEVQQSLIAQVLEDCFPNIDDYVDRDGWLSRTQRDFFEKEERRVSALAYKVACWITETKGYPHTVARAVRGQSDVFPMSELMARFNRFGSIIPLERCSYSHIRGYFILTS